MQRIVGPRRPAPAARRGRAVRRAARERLGERRADRSACRPCAGSPSPPTTGAPSDDEPGERLVEPLPDEPLQRLVAGRALAAEVAPSSRCRQTTPDESSIDPPGRVALLVARRRRAPSSRSADRGDEAGHAGAGDDEVGHV